jgi:hypothetical protein
MPTIDTVSDLPGSQARPQSFIVRIWREDLGNGRSEWRGQVQNVLSHQTRYFRDWPTLVVCFLEMLTEPPTP